MKIAQIAPLWESVPPKLYGGTERVVSYLTEELVRIGHEVTLFATGDSQTRAKLRSVWPRALRLSKGPMDHDAVFISLMKQSLRAGAKDFDVIHWHVDPGTFPLARWCKTPVIATLHGRLDLPELVPLFQDYHDIAMVSISNAQRLPVPGANWHATVYHGLPSNLYSFHPHSGSYLAFLGRIAPEKRPDHAIEIAKRAGIPLRMAAKVDAANRHYFDAVVKPLLNHPLIDFIGELADADKGRFLGAAAAVLCPYDWPEPFGLVFIEAFSCGTPVLAYRRGSIPEIVEDGVTGWVCNDMDEMLDAITKIASIDRRQCRDSFLRRFTVERMTKEYLELYSRMIEGNRPIMVQLAA